VSTPKGCLLYEYDVARVERKNMIKKVPMPFIWLGTFYFHFDLGDVISPAPVPQAQATRLVPSGAREKRGHRACRVEIL